MKAFVIDRYRGELTPRELPDPVPGRGSVPITIPPGKMVIRVVVNCRAPEPEA